MSNMSNRVDMQDAPVTLAAKTLYVTRDGALLSITLNRPQVLNALTPELLTELREALSLAADDAVRAVLLTGAGRGFCSGADLTATPLEDAAAVVETFYNPVVWALMGLRKPVVAAVGGVAAGAGMSLALACDLRLLSESAVFTLGFSRIGLALDAGISYTLPRLVGSARVLELAYSGRKVDAREAMALGLGERVLPADGFAEAATAFAKALSEGPTQSYARIKEQIAVSSDNALEAQLALEARLQGEASRTEDFAEGVGTFAEKREPVFRGR
jgi:2-(1,2-epoxy-1,2-dihydrophenyl)acetyl-CoA isomerase